jgi:hypothetical protein
MNHSILSVFTYTFLKQLLPLRTEIGLEQKNIFITEQEWHEDHLICCLYIRLLRSTFNPPVS